MKHVFFTGAAGGLEELCVKAISKKEDWTVFAADVNENGWGRLYPSRRKIDRR